MIHGESGESAKGGRDEAAKAQASSIISRRSYEGGGRRGAFSKLDGRTSAAAGGEWAGWAARRLPLAAVGDARAWPGVWMAVGITCRRGCVTSRTLVSF